jgi:hypothetical protein
MALFGRTSRSFLISLVVHGVAAAALSIYIVAQHPKVQELIETTFLDAKQTPKPRKRAPVVKTVPKPVVSTEESVSVQQVQVVPRITTAAIAVRTTLDTPSNVLEFSNKYVRFDSYVNPNVPRVVDMTRPVPQVVTHADLPISDAPDALDFAAPVASGTGYGPPIGRGMIGTGIKIAKVAQIGRPAGLAMVTDVGAKLEALSNIVENINLGDVAVQALPRGEPGGRVIGKGKDIQGVFRFTRVRHTLSDWWADASSLNALAKWLNERTKIKTDMNVEGGAVKLTDANVMKCPLLFMTGHDPSMVRSRNLLRQTGGKLDNRLSENETAALRKYVIEKGGFIIFDDCGVNAPAQAMLKIFMGVLRHTLPEYTLERLQPDHEVYNNFYEMGGPPIGFDIFWWGTHPPKRNYLEGYTIGDKLSVLLCRRDYMCAMESVSLPTRSVHYTPGVYRFFTNVAVYSLTHGRIADYSGYVPEDTLAKQELPTSVPQAAKIGATPGEK